MELTHPHSSSTSPHPVLEARAVTVAVGSRTLLDGVSLDVVPGRVTALLGPNGAGKSTLLKVMSGSLQASSGGIFLGGIALREWAPAASARRRAVLSQDPHVPFAFTVFEVALMGRYPHAKHRETRRDETIVRSCLDAADALPLANRLFPTLSGGEKQRTHWARVLAQLDAFAPESPPRGLAGSCILLDEPTSSLDLGHQHALLKHARGLAIDGAGVLVVLHDLNLAAQYADEIAILHAGRIAATGDPEAVLTPGVLKRVYGIEAGVFAHPDNGRPQIFVREPYPENPTPPGANAPSPPNHHTVTA